MPRRTRRRCEWCGADRLYVEYHDREWGAPVHDDRRLFEMLVLEGAQAGLSWLTILRKREAHRRAFDDFDPQRVAHYGEREVRRLLRDPDLIRNPLKIRAAIKNAKAFLAVQREFGTFERFLWSFVGGAPRQNRFRSSEELPTQTPESRALSRALKARGFSFVGPTSCYAFMQAVGLVNDHLVHCFRWREIAVRARRRLADPHASVILLPPR